MQPPSMRSRSPSPRRVGSAAGSCVCGVALGLSLLLAGCQTPPAEELKWQLGPAFVPTNYSGVKLLPAEIRRVAVLPPAGIESLPADSAGAIVDALQAALLAEARFEVVNVDSAFMRSRGGKATYGSGEQLPADLFERIRRDYAADAVLMVDITHHRFYAPLALGVRAKLALATEPHGVIWAFDTLYDVRDPAVANSARRHAALAQRDVADAGVASLQSPSRFAAYVFADVFGVLPKRPPPVAP